MEFRIRDCCCSLRTFVRILGLIMIFSYILCAVASIIVFALFTDNRVFLNNVGSGKFVLVLFIIVLSFIFMGIVVNLLLLLGLNYNKRSLFLPWLVFHFMIILGKLIILGGIFKQQLLLLKIIINLIGRRDS